ncbi:MAG: sigma 54-interacting transcriptional regulator [Gammaproteobacteria bacterium]|nr:sigma 54-interacting transcriptional regulator [Gammaproteobacteria bacterium]
MIRLAVQCHDRVGVVQEIVSVLSVRNIDLRGIELGEQQLYLKLDITTRESKEIVVRLSKINGVGTIQTIEFLPSERDHQELKGLMDQFPEAVVSIARNGEVLQANQAFADLFQLDITQPQNIESVFGRERLDEIFLTLEEHANLKENFEFHGRSMLVEGFRGFHDTFSKHTGAAILLFRLTSDVVSQYEKLKQGELISFDNIIAVSENIERVKQEAQDLAHRHEPLLIEGETGTGKEVFARAIHSLRTPDKPFLALNCASLPDNAAENELFGYSVNKGKKGFVDKQGLIEMAENGTLYLDEIGEMSPYLQVKLLRFLETGRFRRVGTEQEIAIRVKIIASTSYQLDNLSQTGNFRSDLYYRLNVLNLRLPPLRQRRKDILALAEYFIRLAADRLERSIPSLSQRAILALARYNWPGNIRELENLIFRAVSRSSKPQINARDLNMPMLRSLPSEVAEKGIKTSHKFIMQQFERQLFEYLYPQFPSSRKLADQLGLSHTAVAKKLKAFGISNSSDK